MLYHQFSNQKAFKPFASTPSAKGEDPPILVLKDKDPFAKRLRFTIPTTAQASAKASAKALRRKIPGYPFGSRIRRFPDIASRITLKPNHVTNPIILDRKIPNLLIKSDGSAIARQARPPHRVPGNCFGHVLVST
jgi:hypothetical protein